MKPVKKSGIKRRIKMKKSRKMLLTIGMFCLILLLIACGEQIPSESLICGREYHEVGEHLEDMPVPENIMRMSLVGETTTYPLHFNAPEVEYEMEISPAPNFDFHIPLPEADVNVVFPTLNLSTYIEGSIIGFYRKDGSLVEVQANFLMSCFGFYPTTTILMGIGEAPSITSSYGFARAYEFQNSYVGDVVVRAFMFRTHSYDYDGKLNFQATFTNQDINYNITFRDDAEMGKERMSTLVNALVEGGIEGISGITASEIPVMWEEWFSSHLDALEDVEFGGFVPTHVPEGLNFEFGFRSVQEHNHTNSLWMEWQIPQDETHLYEIYTTWVAQRTSDTPVYPFEQVFLGNETLLWHLSPLSDFDEERIRSVADLTEYDWDLFPIFSAYEVTLELIQQHERILSWQPQGADWEEGEDESNIFIPIESTQIWLFIHFDNILLEIQAGNGVTSEMLWQMIESTFVFH